MSKTLELDDMSKDELLALKEEINHRLKDASFWETIEVLSAIDVKAIRLSDKREKIALSCIELKKLKALGFTLVIFSTSKNRVGFINYNIPQIGDKYYGFVVTKDGRLKTVPKKVRKSVIGTEESISCQRVARYIGKEFARITDRVTVYTTFGIRP